MSFLACPASFIDHTLLHAEASPDKIRCLCEEAVEIGFASVCLPPIYVPLAADLLYGSEVAVGTVVGFPLGYLPTAVKVFETTEAVARGASEIDMVIHVAAAQQGEFDSITKDVREVVTAACGAKVKVILECCYLDEATKRGAAMAAIEGGAAFLKTSTGFGGGGATVEDVRLLAELADGCVGVKASGGIRDWDSCRCMLQAGATRIGTSAGLAIVEGWRQAELGL